MYRIVVADEIVDLEIAVNALIEESFTPIGSLVLKGHKLMQPMTNAKHEKLLVASRKLATEADQYQEGEGDRMALDDAINAVYTITGI